MNSEFEKKYRKLCILNALMLGLVFMVYYASPDYVNISDISAHYNFALQLPELMHEGIASFVKNTRYSSILAYPVWHIIFLAFYSILDSILPHLSSFWIPDRICIIAETIENTILLVATYIIIAKIIFLKLNERISSVRLLGAIPVALMFIGPLYVPFVNKNYYLGQLMPSVWHNPSTLIVRPAAIAVFYVFCSLYTERDTKKKNWFAFSLLLAVSALCKPSFYQVFVPALVVFCLFDCISSKGKNIRFDLYTAAAVLPTGAIAIIQESIVSSATGMKFVFRPFATWNLYSDCVAGSLLISVMFPLLMLIFTNKRTEKTTCLAWITFTVGLSYFILFSMQAASGQVYDEKAGDMLWGVLLALQILFLDAVITLFQKRSENNKWAFRVLSGIFIIHCICGMGYFAVTFIMKTPYI